MSTIVRSGLRRGRAGGSREIRERTPLSARAVRVRNACLRQAAIELGLPVPDDAELNAIPVDVTLADAVRRWTVRAPGAADAAQPPRSVGLVLRAALITGVTLIGLAFSYGQAG